MIVILCGPSASGKDTLMNNLVEKEHFGRIISTTTRPMREGEQNGREYHFVSEKEFLSDIENDRFLEYRSYQTLVADTPSTWYYGCSKKDIDALDKTDTQVIILDPKGARDLIGYYGEENCFLCLVQAPEQERKAKAMSRGSFDETEWNRRAADDKRVFAPENMEDLHYYAIPNLGTIEELHDIFMEALSKKKDLSYRTAIVDWDVVDPEDIAIRPPREVIIPESVITEALQDGDRKSVV